MVLASQPKEIMMDKQERIPWGREARRLWIQEQAEAMCLPGWATPRWQRLYGKKP